MPGTRRLNRTAVERLVRGFWGSRSRVWITETGAAVGLEKNPGRTVLGEGFDFEDALDRAFGTGSYAASETKSAQTPTDPTP